MDKKLLTWGLRRRRGAASGLNMPRLWLFTDAQRLADPRPAAAALPAGAAGVVLRHDLDPREPVAKSDALATAEAEIRDAGIQRARLGRDLARICRARRLVLVVAGDLRLAAALGAGVHLRRGRWPGLVRPRGVVTSSAHSIQELRRAARAGVDLAFVSPAFPTASHAGAPALGPLRWGSIALRQPAVRHGMQLAALGGVTGASIKRLPARLCHAAGAIGALAP